MQDNKFLIPPPYHKLSTGTLLVASPDVDQGEYEKKVILICFKDQAKTLGICLNQIHSSSFDKIFLGIDPPSNPNIRLLDGGLDDQDHIMIIHSPIKDTYLPSWKINKGTDFLIEQDDISPLLLHPTNPHIFISVGYFHWDPGALEEELYSGHWLLYPSHNIDIFSLETKTMWNTMIGLIGGKYKAFEYMPENLSAN